MAEDQSSDSPTLVNIEALELCKERLPLSQPSSVLGKITSNKVYHSTIDSDLIKFGCRSAFNTFITAYAKHYPITLSPDIVWLLILQGFSRFVDFNAEKLREHFVKFEGKKKIKVVCDIHSPECSRKHWEQVISQFCDEISKDIGKDLINNITPNFTTTTQTSLTACQLTIMATFKKYFWYDAVGATCGIPYVILEGTLEDWKKVKEKCRVLAENQLPWADKLDSIIDEFINAKEGKINKEFWRTMVRRKDGTGSYDPDIYTGWFTYFFPYNELGNYFNGRIRTTTKTATELLTCPLTLDVVGLDGLTIIATYNLNLLSGFVGVSQDPKTLSLKPEIGWIVEDDSKPSRPKPPF